MSDSLKYAVVERERHYTLANLPDGVVSTSDILDRYVDGTRLRLREVRENDGSVTRKLTHKVRLTEAPAAVACTNFYLNDAEWALLVALPARLLRKRRHLVRHDGLLRPARPAEWCRAVIDERCDATYGAVEVVIAATTER